MSISEKLTTIAENQRLVYDAGKKAEYDRFWDSYQQNGERVNYGFAFAGQWYDNIFYPKYDLMVNSTAYMFYSTGITDLAARLKECNVILDTSNATSLDNCFAYSVITHLPEISAIKVASFGNVFNKARNIHTIDKFILKDDGSQTFTANTFSECYALENIVIEGTIGQNGFNVSSSTKLTKDSLFGKLATEEQIATGKNIVELNGNYYWGGIFGALKDYSKDTSGTHTITLGGTNLKNLTDAEKAIATEKGWTLA